MRFRTERAPQGRASGFMRHRKKSARPCKMAGRGPFLPKKDGDGRHRAAHTALAAAHSLCYSERKNTKILAEIRIKRTLFVTLPTG